MSNSSEFKKDLLENILSTKESYKSRSRRLIIELANNPQPSFSQLVPIFQHILQNYMEYKPMILLNTLRFIKELMDLKSQSIVQEVEKKLYPHILTLAYFKKNEKNDDDRGRFLFVPLVSSQRLSEYESKVIGNSCLRLCLECILMWRLSFPRTDFETEADRLLSEGVKFPSDIFYFKKFESYLKNPTEKSKYENLELQSNDSPDNLFVGYKSEVDVLNKVQKGLEDFENVQKEFQRILASSDGKLLSNEQFFRIMEKLQEASKKSFKFQEMVMHSNLDGKASHDYMERLFQNTEFFDEVLEDYKQLTNKQVKEAYFIAKYRGNITDSEDMNGGQRKSSLSDFSERVRSVEKIQATIMTKDEFLNKFGKDGHSSSIQKQMTDGLEHSKDPDRGDTHERGQYFIESQEIPKNTRNSNNNSAGFSGKLVLKKIDFGAIPSQMNNVNSSSPLNYLGKQLPVLKKQKKRESDTLNGAEVELPKGVNAGEATINVVNIQNIQNLKSERIPLVSERLLNTMSESGLEERDRISNLSQHVPTFGNIFFQSSRFISEELASTREELLSEKKKLQERFETLQKSESELDEKRRLLSDSEKRVLFTRKIQEKNMQISSLRQKIRSLAKLTENSNDGDLYLRELNLKRQKLLNENSLLKHILKISIPFNAENGFPSVSFNTAPNPNQRVAPKPPLDLLLSRNGSVRSLKPDERRSNHPFLRNRNSSSFRSEKPDDHFLKDVQITNYYKENIQRLKLCCLKNKGVLFKSQELQIGAMTDLQNFKDKKLWKIYLYFENLLPNQMLSNLNLHFRAGDQTSIWVKAPDETIGTLKPREQLLREVIVEFKSIPFNLATLEFKYQSFDKITKNIIALPNFPLKMASFHQTNHNEIHSFWTKHKAKCEKLEEFEVLPFFFTEKGNIEDFFPFFVERKAKKKSLGGLEKREFFCRFSFLGVEVMTKVKVLTQKAGEKYLGLIKMIFTEHERSSNIELNDFLLSSFKFLLSKV